MKMLGGVERYVTVSKLSGYPPKIYACGSDMFSYQKRNREANASCAVGYRGKRPLSISAINLLAGEGCFSGFFST